MAFHHRSSASGSSSLSLSHNSRTSNSSSQSSPTSSPDSLATQGSVAAAPNGSFPSRLRYPAPSSSVVVPFSWEEKPGVLKKEMMASSLPKGQSGCTYATPIDVHYSVNVDLLEADSACAATQYDQLQSSNRSRTLLTPTCRPKADYSCQEFPQIRLPPSLSHPELLASKGGSGEGASPPLLAHQNQQRGKGNLSAAVVGSKILAKLSLHKKPHYRRPSSLDDDPFWLAIRACTNDADEAADSRVGTSPKRSVARELNRPDSWVSRRVEESIQLDKCVPPHVMSEKRIISWESQTERRESEAVNRATDSDAVRARKCANNHRILANDAQRSNSRQLDARYFDHASGKAMKALNVAREESQSRHKTFLHHRGPPIVDVSCSLSKSGFLSKKKFRDPDESRKSSHLLTSMNSRFS